MLTGCGVGGDEGGSGKTAINFYSFNEPGGSYDKAVEDCNKEAAGKYKISYVKLPTDANQQRELDRASPRRRGSKTSTSSAWT